MTIARHRIAVLRSKYLRRKQLVTLLSIAFLLTTPMLASATMLFVHCHNRVADAGQINNIIRHSHSGDEIVIEGECLLDQTIVLRGNRSYRGNSRSGTILRQSRDADLVALLASEGFMHDDPNTGAPVSVRQLTLDGNRAKANASTTTGIILRSWQSVIRDVQIAGMSGDGIRIANSSIHHTRLTSTQVNGRIEGNFIRDSGRYGIYVEDPGNAVTDWQLLDNYIADSGADAIHLENAAGWMIFRNHIYGVAQHAIYANRLYGTTITDNLIEDFGSAGLTGAWYGIGVTVQGESPSIISNNHITSKEPDPLSRYLYIAILRANYGSPLISVTGNAISGAGSGQGTALGYFKSNDAATLTVTSFGNAVTNTHVIVSHNIDVTINNGY